MAVRTKQLFVGGVAAGGAQTLYTCPTGETAIVKYVTVHAAPGSSGELILRVNVPSGPTVPMVRSSPPSGTATQYHTWVVLSPGHQLTTLAGAGGSFGLTISGTELDGVAT